MTLLTLQAGNYRLVLQPELGGSIARFDWQDEPLLRPTCGSSVLDTACFPLVPFSNRIAHGRFEVDGVPIALTPNFPGSDHPHPLHGFGWLSSWQVIAADGSSATLRHDDAPAEWPWPYVAQQTFRLTPTGLHHHLSVTNRGASPMPAGLGVHPYFPRSDETRLVSLHRGEWTTAQDGLPIALDLRPRAIDWWAGQPISSRSVDTVYTGREGPLIVTWPEQALTLTITPSSELGFTVIYTPPGVDFFCVESVSHATDAVNRSDPDNGLRSLEPQQTLGAHVHYQACRFGLGYD